MGKYAQLWEVDWLGAFSLVGKTSTFHTRLEGPEFNLYQGGDGICDDCSISGFEFDSLDTYCWLRGGDKILYMIENPKSTVDFVRILWTLRVFLQKKKLLVVFLGSKGHCKSGRKFCTGVKFPPLVNLNKQPTDRHTSRSICI